VRSKSHWRGHLSTVSIALVEGAILESTMPRFAFDFDSARARHRRLDPECVARTEAGLVAEWCCQRRDDLEAVLAVEVRDRSRSC